VNVSHMHTIKSCHSLTTHKHTDFRY